MKIAILGAGNMGSAIACGLVRSGKFQAEEIVCTARTETTLERLRTQCPGVRTTTDNAAAVRDAAVVMLAVKPWLTEALIREIPTGSRWFRWRPVFRWRSSPSG